ncbi:kinase-like domain-containing protein [Suillus subaureus]|uniref:non-specific serine/threonine protein kinase n=1 Tax=Suillus subaureus TaxID=48587 RepID=A0A9P7E0S0_9AGAM|nr:kinase-like domain-containing protein [Suillus subaureus]KAG1808224.1 kinase-like domain-containing protein [Suillus subaureus]
MLPLDHPRLGPKVTLKLITPSSLSPPQLSSASSDVPDIMPLPIPIPKITGDINTVDLNSKLPDFLCPSHMELDDPPAPIHAFTLPGTTEGSTPRIPLLSYVNGPFRVWRQLSTGGFARAMGAEDIASGRLLCLKVFSKDRLKHNKTEEGLLNELKVYKRLASSREYCPATTFLMELEMSFQTKKKICFVMDLMTNDLLHYMENQSAYCVQNARRWSAQLALGINALHNMGIIHRDIKAENVLIDMRQNVRIADFGLSYIDEEPKLLTSWQDYASDVKGTIYCMAPEILRNKKNPDSMRYGTPVDWWAFGCVLYELISPDHQELFDSEDAIMEYVSWHSKHRGTFDLFPAFHQLDSLMADLVVGLLNPLAILRYGFHRVTNHRYFSNSDGTSEFHGACSRALQREKQPQMLPKLWDEQTQSAEIWCAPPFGRSTHTSNVDWRKPRP